MVERALSMREVAGSMPASSRPLIWVREGVDMSHLLAFSLFGTFYFLPYFLLYGKLIIKIIRLKKRPKAMS